MKHDLTSPEPVEKTFYDDPEICVTSARLLLHGRPVSLEDVQSVEQSVEEPARIGWPAAALAGGLLGMLVELSRDQAAMAFLYLVGALGAALWMASHRTSFTISLVKPDEKVAVVVSQNKEFARAVLRAIAEAIAHRGAIGHG